MTDKPRADNARPGADRRPETDWAEVVARRASLNSRDGGDFRLNAILKRLAVLKQTP